MAQQFDSGGRGLFSCLYSECDDASLPEDTEQVLDDLILDLYEEAFHRLPFEDMAADGAVDLVGLIKDGGLCLGLLDPVSNIILNAASLLPPGFASSSSASSTPAALPRKSEIEISRSTWEMIAWRSYNGLVDFMMRYFGCLSEEQATRYLRWAGADLALAVLLVEHDLHAAEPASPDPGSERTQAALKHAAVKAHHPAPDILVRLAASLLPRARLEAVVDPVLLAGKKRRRLTVDDLAAVADLARDLEKPACHASVKLLPHGGGAIVGVRKLAVDGVVTHTTTTDHGDGYTTTTTTTVRRVGDYVASLRRPEDMASMLSACLSQAADAQGRRRGLKRPCAGTACEHLESLQMRIHAAIHGFYLEALSRLPPPGGMHMVRAILVAGHCYGPMDPVSNIILNSVWYDTSFPLPAADRGDIQTYDVLDTVSMLRTEARSLKGLIALVHATATATTTTSGSRSSMHEALEHLLHRQCDLSDALRGATNSNLFAAAAAAARHPQHAALASFHASLPPETLDKLRSLLSATANRALCRDTLEKIHAILREEPSSCSSSSSAIAAPKLCEEAMRTLSRIRSAYVERQRFLRGHIQKLLQEYASQHPWEPKYTLNFICGVEEETGTNPINFMAAPQESPLHKNTLFFALENFCCPLSPPYTGRCYYGVASARKLVYPDAADYFTTNDITAYGTNSQDEMMETDFVCFDSERDVEFAELVNGCYAPGFPVMRRPYVLHSPETRAGFPAFVCVEKP